MSFTLFNRGLMNLVRNTAPEPKQLAFIDDGVFYPHEPNNVDVEKFKNGGKSFTLGELINHTKLEEKGLNSLPVIKDPNMDGAGVNNGKRIKINPNYSDDVIRRTLLHEGQHSVTGDVAKDKKTVPHTLRRQEQEPLIFDKIMHGNYMLNNLGRTVEEVNNYYDGRIKMLEFKDRRTPSDITKKEIEQYEKAKVLFNNAFDEGKRAIA
jgi:hypothetical protein